MPVFKQGNENNHKDEKRTNMNRNEERAEKNIKKATFRLKDCAGCDDWHDACARRLGIEPDIFLRLRLT